MKTIINESGCTTKAHHSPELEVVIPMTLNGVNVGEQLSQAAAKILSLSLKIEELSSRLESLSQAVANLHTTSPEPAAEAPKPAKKAPPTPAKPAE